MNGQSEASEARLKALTDKLETGVSHIFESDQYTEYLATMSKFHHYSFRNILLIFMQRPDATCVAGYNDWKNKFGRHVKAHEHGIQILAPSTTRRPTSRCMARTASPSWSGSRRRRSHTGS